MRSFTKAILLLPILLLLLGCANTNLPVTVYLREFDGQPQNVRIIGENVRLDQIILILAALEHLNQSMVTPGLAVHVRDEPEHFGICWNGRQGIGHHCNWPRPAKVCVFRGWLSKELIWHEVGGHVYHGYLHSQGSNFTSEWLKIAGDVYDENLNAADVQDGLLDNYARGDYREDVAVWVSECLKYLANEFVFWKNNPRIKSDPRYRLKLELLFKYKFFSAEQYEKLKPLFE